MKIIKSACWTIFWFVTWLALLTGIFAFFVLLLDLNNSSYDWLFITGAVVMAVAALILLKIGSKALKMEEKKSLICLVLGAALSSVVLITIPLSIGIVFIAFTHAFGGY